MSDEHNKNYRPKSPDLSGINPPPRLARIPSYHPDPALPPGYPVSARGSYDASPFFSPQTTTPSTSYFGARPQSSFSGSYSPQTFRTPSTANQPSPVIHSQTLPQPYDNSQPLYYDQSQNQPSADPSFFGQQPYQQHYQEPSYYPQGPTPQYVDMPRTRQRKAEDFDQDYNPNGLAAGMQLKTEPVNTTQPVMPIATADPSHGIDVRTKFPVARIKRIMQADEDVGKVAQATPTAVSKALELFMITLVMKGASEARANSSKRVTAQHLKAALMKDGQFDFLTEICESVPDEGSKKGRAKSEAKSEESDEDIAPKKKGKGGRKRKAESDDDTE